jgi:hypothetical protein
MTGDLGFLAVRVVNVVCDDTGVVSLRGASASPADRSADSSVLVMASRHAVSSAVSGFLVPGFVHLVAFPIFASDSIAIGEASGQRLSPIHF